VEVGSEGVVSLVIGTSWIVFGDPLSMFLGREWFRDDFGRVGVGKSARFLSIKSDKTKATV